ncbi:unnamed protein product [Closterium sp. Naga37s-1]|nr:unnamed protein product [Closterium sp. Naga37s-1]
MIPPPATRFGQKQAVVPLPLTFRLPRLPILLLLALGTVLLARWPVLRGHVARDPEIGAVNSILVGRSWAAIEEASIEDDAHTLEGEKHGVGSIGGRDGKGGESYERIEWALRESGWAEEERETAQNAEGSDGRGDSREAERVGEISQEGEGHMAESENADVGGTTEGGGREVGDAVRFTPLQGFLEEAEKWHAGLGRRSGGGNGGEAEGAGGAAEGEAAEIRRLAEVEGGGEGGKAAEEGSLRFPVRVVGGHVRTRRLVGDDDTALIVRTVNYGFAACEFSPFHSKPRHERDYPIQSNHSAIQHRPELLALAAEMGRAMGGGNYDAVHVRRGDKLNPNMWPHLDRDTRPPAAPIALYALTGTAPTALTGTAPTALTGTAPTALTGTAPTALTGTAPTALTGTAPTALTGTAPTALTGTAPTALTGTAPTALTALSALTFLYSPTSPFSPVPLFSCSLQPYCLSTPGP